MAGNGEAKNIMWRVAFTSRKTGARQARSPSRHDGLGRLSALCVAVGLAAVAGMAWGTATEEPLPRLTLVVDGLPLQVEVAFTARARAHGLAGRTALAEDAGMLFVFSRHGRPCFWMKDTVIPLSLFFLDDHGRILQREELLPGDKRSICAKQAVRFALEVGSHGHSAQRLQSGQRVKGLPKHAPHRSGIPVSAAADEKSGA